MRLLQISIAFCIAALLAGCAPKSAESGGAARADIVIGATIPLSGALASFGSYQQWGYQHAVAEINAAGGITVDGNQRQVRLILLDDKTDPNVAAANIDTLTSSNRVDALLGSCTPPLVIAASLAAERDATPMVSGCAPLVSFTSARQWNWSWDIFFNDPDLAEAPFHAWQDLNVQSNKKIVILHDNSADGTVIGKQQWPQLAAKYGYTVVANLEFPTDTSNFEASVAQAKASGADILMIDTLTPQMVSIRKQMAAVAYTPKLLDMEKGAEPAQFAQAVGPLADGVMVGAYWDPSFSYPGASDLGTAFAHDTGRTVSQHIADSYTAARVLFDAMKAAATLDKTKVNAAIGMTHATYPVGPVQFGNNHAAALQVVSSQWQGGTPKIVWPSDRANAMLLVPVPIH